MSLCARDLLAQEIYLKNTVKLEAKTPSPLALYANMLTHLATVDTLVIFLKRNQQQAKQDPDCLTGRVYILDMYTATTFVTCQVWIFCQMSFNYL